MLATNTVQGSRPPVSATLVPNFGKRVLFGNSLWNLAGDGLPLLVAIFCVPAIIHGMGKERFGVLTLSWMIVGYLSLLDLGLGKALTKYLSEKFALERRQEIPGLFWTSFILMSVVGLIGTCGMLAGSPWIVYRGLNVPPALRPETQFALRMIALSVPALVTAAACRGLFAALQRFDLINVIRIPISVLSFVTPLAALHISRSLALIVGLLVGIRVAAWLVQMALCLRIVPELRCRPRLDYHNVRPLLSFGGWLSSAIAVGSLSVYADRLLIGSVLSMSSVAYYSTPFEVIYKFQILPAAIAQVMFPAFSYNLAKSPERAALLFEQANKYVLLLIFPVAMFSAIFAPELLRAWLGVDFARTSTFVTRCLTACLLLTGVTYVPSAMIQAAGRPDLFALVALIETPLYLPLVWFGISKFGINGAAMAALVRAAVNAIVGFLLVGMVVPATAPNLNRSMAAVAGALCILALSTSTPGGLATKAVFAVGVLILSAYTAWRLLLNHSDRNFLLDRLGVIRAWV